MGILSFFKRKKKNSVKKDEEKSITAEKIIEVANKHQAETHYRIIKDSIRIVNTTTKPSTFFSRYELLIDKLGELGELAESIEFTGEDPKEYLKELKQNEFSLFNEFINRYYDEVLLKINNLKTEKAKLNNANKFKEELFEYQEYLKSENIEVINDLYVNLQENI